ncbi:MAG: hypothetical protein DRP85_01120 [Candidatus Makaraimicrobium thalassicum]|nr:MAG: hypothetical protein DRP85_01120 [Candidatus Omnitrophota bacterium]
MGVWQYLSLGRKSLKYKLMIAFSLMSILPLLVIAYFVTNYVFPETQADMFQASAIVLFSLWVAWSGYLLAKELIIPIVNLAIETKIIAGGHFDSNILLKRDDELGDIASAVNSMTGKIRGYVKELQEYSKKTASLNVRIHRKVLTLTNLMRLGDLISSGAKFKEVANFATERLAQELYGGFCAIFTREKTGTYSLESFFNDSGKNIVVTDIGPELPSMEKFFVRDECLMVDSRPRKGSWQEELRKKLAKVNVVLFPMKVNANIVGIIMFGNSAEGVEFGDEDVDVIRAYEKELVLGYQSSRTGERVKSLEVVDSLTGLYTFSYIEEQLQDEINRAVYYQRPCSMIVLSVDDFEKYSDHYGASKAKHVLRQLADLLSASVSPVSKIARSDHNEFGVLLPETNKRESLEMAEHIRGKIEKMELSTEANDRLTASIGVGENPIDGTNAKEIIDKARQYMEKARAQGKNKVMGE